jgi:hypothetical protein
MVSDDGFLGVILGHELFAVTDAVAVLAFQAEIRRLGEDPPGFVFQGIVDAFHEIGGRRLQVLLPDLGDAFDDGFVADLLEIFEVVDPKVDSPALLDNEGFNGLDDLFGGVLISILREQKNIFCHGFLLKLYLYY